MVINILEDKIISFTDMTEIINTAIKDKLYNKGKSSIVRKDN